MFDDITISALHGALRGLAERQRVSADNIANINTPNFHAGRVDFESALRDAVNNGDAAGANGDPGVALSTEPTRLDGNNVNLDEETLIQMDTGLRYSLALRGVDDQFSLLRSALRSS
ncbi:MAG: flagellar basal body rod protein FlgB [Actinomycetes bacterium]